MVLPGQEPVGPTVDLGPFWIAWEQIEQEYLRRTEYSVAADFWDSYSNKLVQSRNDINGYRTDLERNSGWTSSDSAAAAAFYVRIEAGIESIDGWLGGRPNQPGFEPRTSGIGEAFRNLVREIEVAYGSVAELKDWLVQQDKVVSTDFTLVPPELVATHTTAKITDQDRGLVTVFDTTVGLIRDTVNDATGRRDALTRRPDGPYANVIAQLNTLQDTQKWEGPTALATGAPPGGPTGAGGPGAAPPGSPTGPSPGGPGTPPGPGPDAPAITESTPDPGADVPGADQPGDSGPATTDLTTSLPGARDSGATLPSSDPELAGAPTATLTPLPGTIASGSSVPTGVPGLPGGNPGFSPVVSPAISPFPLTHAAGTSLPARRDGFEPIRPGSDVDGRSGGSTPGTPGTGVPAAEAPVRPQGGSSTDAGSVGRPGFFSPLVPPVYPAVGGSGSGIRPGVAESAGPPTWHTGGRDTWRAGLRSQLLGRVGDRRDGPRDIQPEYSHPGGEVLDEELWQVPSAAPATPPDVRPLRGRPRGS